MKLYQALLLAIRPIGLGKCTDVRGRHRCGTISLVMLYVIGPEEKPTPMWVCAAMRRPTLRDPGAMPAPTIARSVAAMSSVLRAWNASEADARTGDRTAWTSEREFRTQLFVMGAFNATPICVSYRE